MRTCSATYASRYVFRSNLFFIAIIPEPVAGNTPAVVVLDFSLTVLSDIAGISWDKPVPFFFSANQDRKLHAPWPEVADWTVLNAISFEADLT